MDTLPEVFFQRVARLLHNPERKFIYKKKTVLHEIGHQKQSKILGWLYLLLVGLPSIIGNLLFRIKYVKTHFDYYNLPWEKWADKLGGVSR